MRKDSCPSETRVSRQIVDPEVQALAAISVTLQADYAAEGLAWHGSPFAWIKTRPSRQIGVIGEKLIAGWLAAKDCDVVRSPDCEADRVINGRRAEIKFSTLWTAGFYKFQQIRNQNYELAICLGVSPFDAHCWAIPKSVLMEQWRTGGIESQHGGRAGSDTAWLTVCVGREPAWLGEWGGSLGQGARKILAITGRA